MVINCRQTNLLDAVPKSGRSCVCTVNSFNQILKRQIQTETRQIFYALILSL